MQPETIKTSLECDKDGTWYYVHIPKQVRGKFKALEKRGAIKVTSTIGNSTWNGSMLPWADGSAQIVINKKVRLHEQLELGHELTIVIQPRER